MDQSHIDDGARQLMELAQNIMIERGVTQKEALDIVKRALHLQSYLEIEDSWREKGDYDEATRQYLNVYKAVMGSDWEVPGWSQKDGVTTQKYAELALGEIIGMMRVCTGIAQCRHKLGDLQGALDWIEEVDILYQHAHYTIEIQLPWRVFDCPDSPAFYETRTIAYILAADIFFKLGNTAAAAHRRVAAFTQYATRTDYPDGANLELIVDIKECFKMTELRHPDPSLVSKLQVVDAALSVRGSWNKLPCPKSGRLHAGSRLGFSSFIWKGCMYIGGGMKNKDLHERKHYRDFFCLDLSKLDTWRELPPFDMPEHISGLWLSHTMVVHDSKAYLFTGRPQIDIFDLVSETWSCRWTAMELESVPWPYTGMTLMDYNMQVFDGCLYVFGGGHGDCQLGCNVLMKLDLATYKWTHLSGTSLPKVNKDLPGPRIYASSWMAGDRLFIFNGMANRTSAKQHGQPHGEDIDYPYDDMWSWSIPKQMWRRERVMGNAPSARCESACVYNPKLKQTVLFGGYSPCVGTDMGPGQGMQPFSYYADTFIYNHVTSTWRQVLTRGFPTYRAQSHLLADPDLGKTFLVGGYTNLEWIQTRRKHVSRSFDDIWQLSVDEEGGCYEEGAFEAESKTAQAGPWKRCFACGSVGRSQKCGGSCKGKAVFCDTQCLQDGWKEHKKVDKCGKLEKASK